MQRARYSAARGSLVSSCRKLRQNRWLVFVPSLWINSCSGIAFAYGSFSPLLKTVLGYSQQQITFLGIAKNFGASMGLLPGTLSAILPPWCLIALGALHYMIGYGGLWLIVTGRVPILPMWAVCILILLGSNGDTYLSTAGIVTNVYNFPKSQGHVVGMIKGFNGICPAIYNQVYMTFLAPDQASYLLMVAAGPGIISALTMFFVRRIDSRPDLDGGPSDDRLGFYLIYANCLIMAAYLLAVLIAQDVMTFGFKARLAFTLALLVMLSSLLATPLATWAAERMRRRGELTTCASAFGSDDAEEIRVPLVGGCEVSEQSRNFVSDTLNGNNVAIGKLYDPKTEPGEEKKMMGAGAGQARVNGPRNDGQQFTLWQALVDVDAWLLFCGLIFGAATGLAAIDNMGQISESLGYKNSSIFVSMASIFNFVGRILGGYISELLARTYKLPRSWALVMALGMMIVGHILIAFGWPGALYISTILVGAGYGSYWGIVPPTLSELFGMRNLGVLYNVSCMVVPIGVLIFSGFLAGYVYDSEAAKQGQYTHHIASMLVSSSTSCSGAVCFRLSFLIMAGSCFGSIFLTILTSIRTRSRYKTMYD